MYYNGFGYNVPLNESYTYPSNSYDPTSWSTACPITMPSKEILIINQNSNSQTTQTTQTTQLIQTTTYNISSNSTNLLPVTEVLVILGSVLIIIIIAIKTSQKNPLSKNETEYSSKEKQDLFVCNICHNAISLEDIYCYNCGNKLK